MSGHWFGVAAAVPAASPWHPGNVELASQMQVQVAMVGSWTIASHVGVSARAPGARPNNAPARATVSQNEYHVAGERCMSLPPRGWSGAGSADPTTRLTPYPRCCAVIRVLVLSEFILIVRPFVYAVNTADENGISAASKTVLS
jgi:hypothetical protein